MQSALADIFLLHLVASSQASFLIGENLNFLRLKKEPPAMQDSPFCAVADNSIPQVFMLPQFLHDIFA